MSSIEQRVMASVGVIYMARQLVSATAIKVYVLAASVGGIASVVSVPNVLHNVETVGPARWPVFLEVAVLKTQLLVQISLAAGLVALGLLLVDVIRHSAHSTTRARLA